MMFHLQKCSWVQSNEFGFFFPSIDDIFLTKNVQESRRQSWQIHINFSIRNGTHARDAPRFMGFQKLAHSEPHSLDHSLILVPNDARAVVSYSVWPYFTIGKTQQTVRASKGSLAGKPTDPNFTNIWVPSGILLLANTRHLDNGPMFSSKFCKTAVLPCFWMFFSF